MTDETSAMFQYINVIFRMTHVHLTSRDADPQLASTNEYWTETVKFKMDLFVSKSRGLQC